MLIKWKTCCTDCWAKSVYCSNTHQRISPRLAHILIFPDIFLTGIIFLQAHPQIVYYNCVKLHQYWFIRLGSRLRLREIWTAFRRGCAYEEYEQRLGGVALTRNMDNVYEGLRLRGIWTAFRRSCAYEKYGQRLGGVALTRNMDSV